MNTDWTIETLKQYFDERFSASKEAIAQALVAQKELYQTVQTAADKAITKAETAQNQYNVGHNDLARKMEAQYKEMIPRTEFDSREKNMHEKHDELLKTVAIISSRLDLIAGRGGGYKDFIGWIFAGITIIILIVREFIK